MVGIKVINELKKSAVFFFYPFCIYLLSHMFPTDILSQSSLLNSIIDFLSGYIPALVGLSERSKYPEVFQILFVLQILSIPFLMYFFSKQDYVDRGSLHRRKKIIGKLIFIGFFVVFSILFFLFFYFASENYSNPKSNSKYSQLSAAVLTSKFWFSAYVGMFFMFLSLFFYGTFFYIVQYYKNFMEERSK